MLGGPFPLCATSLARRPHVMLATGYFTDHISNANDRFQFAVRSPLSPACYWAGVKDPGWRNEGAATVTPSPALATVGNGEGV